MRFVHVVDDLSHASNVSDYSPSVPFGGFRGSRRVAEDSVECDEQDVTTDPRSGSATAPRASNSGCSELRSQTHA